MRHTTSHFYRQIQKTTLGRFEPRALRWPYVSRMVSPLKRRPITHILSFTFIKIPLFVHHFL